ncbi:hypothetical protein HDV06_001012 [Boothiomyces sp. JEL0866]|nr:hypothetical protein HDV06_001012 [Boothiomyces sp. JEL0866]
MVEINSLLGVTGSAISHFASKASSITWQPSYGGVVGTSCDFPGNDIATGIVATPASASSCIVACERRSGCTHYSYSTATSTCNIKSGTVNQSNAVFDNGLECGILPLNHPTWTDGKGATPAHFGQNCQFPGTVIGTKSNMASYGYCYTACANTPTCTHYNFDSTGTCYFITGSVSLLDASYQSGEQCGVLANIIH